jgi:hypothetical protein
VAVDEVAGAGISNTIDDAVRVSFEKLVSEDSRDDINNDVGEAVGPVLRISNADPIGLAIGKVDGAGGEDATGVKVSRDAGEGILVIA